MRNFIDIIESTGTFEQYMHGDCDLFALAVNTITGWPIVLEVDEDGEYQHVLNQQGPTELFDIGGSRPMLSDEELSHYHGHTISLKIVSREWLLRNLPSRQKENLASRLKAAEAVAHEIL
jgi:hypothetical protein